VFTESLPSNGVYPAVACVFIVAGMCLPSRCPATEVIRLLPAYSYCRECVYQVVAQQRRLSDCCLRIHSRGNVLTESLPSNGPTRRRIIIYCDVTLSVIVRAITAGMSVDSRYNDGLRAGRPGFDSRQGREILLFSTVSRPALGPTRPPIHWVLGTLFPAVKAARA
jgi:hypothetical protein